MGRDKLMLEYQGKPILQHSIDMLTDLPVYECIIVTSGIRADRVILHRDLILAKNENPENGLSKSIQLGVEAATGTHYLFLTADQPKLKASDLKPIFEAVNAEPDKIIYPLIDLKPGSPTLFPGSFRKELLNLHTTSHGEQNDIGGRRIRDENKQLCVTFKPKEPANFKDIDDPDDFAKLQ